jgi:hypothetical protein
MQKSFTVQYQTQCDCSNTTYIYIMDLQPFYGEGPFLQPGSQAACRKITLSGIPNCLNYCVIFIVYTQFTHVAGVARRPWVGDPWYIWINVHTYTHEIVLIACHMFKQIHLTHVPLSDSSQHSKDCYSLL